MPTWKKYKFSEIVSIVGGGTPKTTIEEYWNGPIPWLSVVDFQGDRKHVSETEKSITELGLHKSSTKLLPKGSVIISARGTVGELAVLSQEMAFNQSCYGLLANDLSTNEFVYYLLKQKVAQLKNHSHGSVFSTIIRQTFDEIEIHLPPLPTQHRIAEILGALDDKIELNLQMNKTLEDMAMALYKHWFVDFGPFKEGEFVDSELGMIPKGWEVCKLQDHFVLARGLSYKGKHLSVDIDDIPMHNLNSIYEGGYYKYEGIKYYNGEFQERHKVYPGDLVVANTEQGHEYLLIGSPTLVPKYYGEFGIFTHHLYRIRPKTTSVLTSKYLYYNLLHKPFRRKVTGFCNGTTVNMLQKEGLMYPKIIVPQRTVVNEFESKVNNLIEKREDIFEENQTLTQTRDYLLPKLISGEIEVNAAENEIKELL